MEQLPSAVKLTFISAIALLLLFVLFIIAIMVMYKRRQTATLLQLKLDEANFKNTLLEKDIEKIKALQEERERISMDMHDDLGSKLASIGIQLHLLKNSTTFNSIEIERLESNTSELSSTMKDLVWNLNPSNDTLEKLIDYISSTAKHFFEPTTIKCQIETSDNVPVIVLNGTTRRALVLVCKEIFHNCFKHSQATSIALKFKVSESRFEISIKDNGIGIQKENKLGNGLISIKRRLDSIAASHTLVSNSTGTTHTISYPF